MNYDHISVTAYNSETEGDRLNRLHRVIGYVCALTNQSGNSLLLQKITNLHDHKGTLEVTWASIPSPEEKKYLSKAWESRIGDGADNVEHRFL